MDLGVSLTELGLAYRKAKVDLYYSTNPSLFAVAKYEDQLETNLKRLQENLNGECEAWATEKQFLGDWTLVPKSIELGKSSADSGLVFAAPEEKWVQEAAAGMGPVAEFRLMAECSLDFHVLSALWMMKVGAEFDKKLSDNVYGSRFRRRQNGDINKFSLGSFKSYLKPFRDWRDGGIKAMRSALADDKKIVALTADVTSFYHELNPGFLLDNGFLAPFKLGLSEEKERLHRLFISALVAWAENTPHGRGLPVGLPASAVVANMALLGLDQFIEQQVTPLYYGRYVDDILLVMENTNQISSTESFWKWMFARPQPVGMLSWEGAKKECILFSPGYLKDSRVAFSNSKNKVFILAGAPGATLVDAISEQVNQRASEWRALPDLPESPTGVATDLLKATSHVGEQTDNLRKTDALTMHRAGFALKLRDYEAYELDLPPDAWEKHRHAFFQAVIVHILTPIKFFELHQYLPRIIRMATACEDFDFLKKILHALNEIVKKVETDCSLTVKALNPAKRPADISSRWKLQLHQTIVESIVSAFPPRMSKKGSVLWHRELGEGLYSDWPKLVDKVWVIPELMDVFIKSPKEIQKYQAWLFGYDLGHRPLRFIGFPKEMVSQRGVTPRRKLIFGNVEEVLPAPIKEGIKTVAEWIRLRTGIPSGVYFPTRTFDLIELYVIAKDPFAAPSLASLSRVIYALRGFELTDKVPQWDKRVLRIPNGEPKAKQTIAVSSWETKKESFAAAVTRNPDPNASDRYRRINRLVNELISRPDGAGYLILPEVALPPQWFMRIADKLKGRGISLIAGVEYLHAPKKIVRNQVWASLIHDGLGFPSLMLYRQDKQRPALHEEQELHQLAGVKMRPATEWPTQKPPIIQHGSFSFALMVCSELTNIRYRGDLRGKVDALFVPEWNSDTDTFNALVESAALDIHAYVIQCNNRTYGDSRIRGPYKDRWKRDVLRVKGGNHDYCITGEIDALALRQFQSSHRSPSEGFKPVPDGFSDDMSYDRKVLPKGGEQ